MDTTIKKPISKRIIANSIDLSIICGGFGAILDAIGAILILLISQETYVTAKPIFAILFYLNTFILFTIKDMFFKGQSIGKKLCKLYIIDDKGGLVKSAKTLIKRNLITTLLFPISIITILVKNKGIGDIACNTTVINVK